MIGWSNNPHLTNINMSYGKSYSQLILAVTMIELITFGVAAFIYYLF